MITWKQPANSIFFFLFVVALFILLYRWRRFYQLFQFLGKNEKGKQFLKHTSLIQITIKNILWSIALFFLFLVLLRPAWNEKEKIINQEGRDLFIALDISKSMLAQDVKPNRLSKAKEIIKQLVKKIDATRVGLILFSSSSFIQCPLTQDKAAFLMYLDQIDVDTIASGGTAIEQAIHQALKGFKNSTRKNKLLVVVTDGEDFSQDLSSIKNEALTQNLTIFTIGVGTQQGAPVPLYDENGNTTGHIKDKNGAIVISRVNEKMLENLAHELGGIYIGANSDYTSIDKLLALLHTKEKENFQAQKLSTLQEQYHWFLLISFVLLLLEWIL